MRICHSVSEISADRDLWQVLGEAKKPIVMYGMGNGADKILAVFERRGIEVADFFASDGFVRHQTFHGKTVMSYSEICERYEDFIIVVSFGSCLPEVLENIYRLDAERELYVPDVPVVSESALFDMEFFKAHYAELEAACELFSDELSRRTFCDVIQYRLTGKIAYLRRHTVSEESVMRDLIHAEDIKIAADLGAYNGDSIRALAKYAPGLSAVTAIEPDERTFRKLTSFAAEASCKISAYNCAAWNEEAVLTFTAGGNRNSTLSSTDGVKTGARLKSIAAMPLDGLHRGVCDYIKYDVEGAEYEAILGSERVITENRPRLLVSMYHRNEDLYRLPALVARYGCGRLYLRRYEYVPAWDLNLIVADR